MMEKKPFSSLLPHDPPDVFGDAVYMLKHLYHNSSSEDFREFYGRVRYLFSLREAAKLIGVSHKAIVYKLRNEKDDPNND